MAPDPITDIVVTTRNRLGCLRRTLEYIYERTTSPYWLHVIDDASQEGNAEYLLEEWRAGRVHDLLLRGVRTGAMANMNVGTWLALSDPFVITDDDVLCPQVEPDWLEQLVSAMRAVPDLGICALNHPRARRIKREIEGPVQFCKAVGGTFMGMRRQLAFYSWLPHYRNNFGITPTTTRCQKTRKLRKWRIGYLKHVYCQHIGEVSELTGKRHAAWYHNVPEDAVDPLTLEPYDERFRG